MLVRGICRRPALRASLKRCLGIATRGKLLLWLEMRRSRSRMRRMRSKDTVTVPIDVCLYFFYLFSFCSFLFLLLLLLPFSLLFLPPLSSHPFPLLRFILTGTFLRVPRLVLRNFGFSCSFGSFSTTMRFVVCHCTSARIITYHCSIFRITTTRR